jgi:CAAX prenyl protease-like protein
MNLIGPRFAQSPLAARVVPFAVFIGLTFCQDFFGEAGRYWTYLAKTLLGLWLIVVVRPAIAEMRWKLSWAGLVVGVAVFLMWVGLPGLLKWFGSSGSFAMFKSARTAWNPAAQFAGSPALVWLFIGWHIGGSALVVPPLEEVFYRSFLYRYLARKDFASVALGQFLWLPFLVTSAVFGLEHREWLAGILCGFAYQGLVCWKNRLGDAITAHAITNALLGVWVVWRGAWHFW